MAEIDLYALIGEHIPERYQELYRLAVREAIRLRHAGAGDDVVGHLGGLPLLPAGFDWPAHEHSGYEHVMTLDLSKLPPIDLNLPADGHYSLFFDGDPLLYYFPGDVELHETPLPAEYTQSTRINHRANLTCALIHSLPRAGDMPLAELDGYDDEQDAELARGAKAIDDALDANPEPLHQIGGWALELQSDNDRGVLPGTPADALIYGDEGSGDLMLLMQIDSDPGTHMMWGDHGIIYAFIPPEALADHDLSAASVYMDCC
ncbi:DUF1963 domain-containing protein [Nocardia sp. NPDC055321]